MASSIMFTAVVLAVIDGDTVAVRMLNCKPAFLCQPRVRVLGVDTPESHMPPAKCDTEMAKGQAATAYARTLLKPGRRVRGSFARWDKYGGRIDGTLRLPNGGDLGKAMIAAGYARPYDGGTKSSWCEEK